jgi:uncharacterized protein (DUF169 family)
LKSEYSGNFEKSMVICALGRDQMLDYFILELQLRDRLRLSRRPVAVAFRDSPPAGVPKFAGKEPSGCSFWRIASGGMTFYTIPSDHENCALGSHTHGFPQSPEGAEKYQKALSLMTSKGYIKMEEILSIPCMKQTPGAIIYSPLGDTPMEPDLVVFMVRAMQTMVLQEAALRTGIGLQLPPLGRPVCMSIPAALTQGAVSGMGCLGSRVYTDLGDDEMYLIVPGRSLQKIAEEVETIAETNMRLIEYHREQRKLFETPI